MRTYAPRVRDIDTIDGELRLVARAWHVARELTGRTPSTALIDPLLDERAASSATDNDEIRATAACGVCWWR